MNVANRSVLLIIILILFFILFPIIIGGDNLLDDNDLQANDFMLAWTRFPVYQIILGLLLGISVFVLFGVYMGGRSNRRLFNDRTIDSIHLFGGIFSMTALVRAVIVFRFFETQPVLMNKQLNKNQIRNVPHFKEV